MTNPPVWKTAFLVLITTATIAAVTSWLWSNTADQIRSNERSYQMRALNEIIPASRYNNALFDDMITVQNPELLGTDEGVTVFRARRDNQPVAVIINAVAPKGYSGAIELMIGINADGTIAGVRVSNHRETRGLGDLIEIEKSDWITVFEQRSLTNPAPQAWLVEKDGGEFDQISGATITPRSIVRAVRDALIYFDANQEMLFAAPSET